ncbi:hypothetical protein LCGC14_0747590 [marine sediment metagenome]|uniref:VOC domain-containing protein n=1 Tax=marine sediment metagenome TaxID=412755 RepID=A0A0F9Q4Y1_9ZZZZ
MVGGELEVMRFDHLAVPVENVEAVMRWFQTIHPDTEVLYIDDEWCFLRIGEQKLAFVSEKQHPAHFAFAVSELELRKLALTYGQEIAQHRDDTLSFYMTGPEGVCVEFVTYLRDFNEPDGTPVRGD